MKQQIKVLDCDVLDGLRLRAGYSYADLAEIVGMTRQALHRIFKGQNGPSPAIARKIYKALDVPFDYIFEVIK